MNLYRADLHMHTVLSPCASLEMSPAKIVKKAVENNLDIIGVTDHNSTRHCNLVKKLGNEKGLFVLCGTEITTREEVHCLAFFKNNESLAAMQEFMDKRLPYYKNDIGKFGYQVVIDENENIIEHEERLLIIAINAGIEEIEGKVHELGGIFIPAHIDRKSNSIFSQLGFVPSGLKLEAMGISSFADAGKVRSGFNISNDITLVRNSDAHHPDMIGATYSLFQMVKISWEEIKKALAREDGRMVKII